MKICVQYANGDPRWVHGILAPAVVKEWSLAAEANGFGGIGFTDHPAPSGRWVDSGGEGVCDPFSALGFCAAVTADIRLFTYVLVPAYRNPFLTAQQITTLDHLSGGRLTLGMGTGYLRSEFKALGVDPAGRVAAFEESMALMARAWEGGDIAEVTPLLEARDTRVLPRVAQRPHPPVWLHANGRWGTEWVAKHAQGWLGILTTDRLVGTIHTMAMPDVPALTGRLDHLREACDRNGRTFDALDVGLGGAIPMLDVRRTAADDPRYDPDEMLRRVAELEALGVNWLFVTCCGDDPRAAVESVQAFGESVLAKL